MTVLMLHVLMEVFVWLVESMNLKEVLKYVIIDFGDQCVIFRIGGELMLMLILFVSN